jgi:hypothetical protein
LYGRVLEAFFEDVRVGYYGFEAEVFLKLGWRNRLDVGVYDWEQERSFHCAALSFELADSSKQIFFFSLKAQYANLNRKAEFAYKKH